MPTEAGSKSWAGFIPDYDALAVAREQVEGGANMIDVNMDEGLLDSQAAMTMFVNLPMPLAEAVLSLSSPGLPPGRCQNPCRPG